MTRKLPIFDPSLPREVRDLADLGKLVRSERARSKLRIDDAAALSFVSSDLLSRLENGKPVTTDKLLKVCDALGLRMLLLPAHEAVLLSDGPALQNSAPPQGGTSDANHG